MRKPRLNRLSIIKLYRLLDMQYKPAELAAEIDISPDTIYRSYMPAGAPFTKDKTGSIWIHGLSFKEWAETFQGSKKKNKNSLSPGEGWCFRCKAPVMIEKPRKIKTKNRYFALLQGRCPACDAIVNRSYNPNNSQIDAPDLLGVGEVNSL
jgi:hypothetical protein